jgi:GNAT superfamily N-acetyltransferase
MAMIPRTPTPPRARTVRLADGTPVRLRPIRPSDKAALQGGMARLSPTTRYNRFMGAIRALTPAQLAYLTEVDQVDHIAWIATTRRQGIGVARCVRDAADPSVAEAAIVVGDEWQGRGVGRLLVDALRRAALAQGVTRFRGEVRADNRRMLALVTAVHGTIAGPSADGSGTVVVELPVAIRADAPHPPR